MKRLFIDFDGVILDTIPLLYEEAKRQEYEATDAEFYKNFNFKCILKDKYIINDAVNSINKLIESGLFEISILTHVNSLKEASDKVNYIRTHFSDITVIICPKNISKTKMVHTKGAILVDDYAGNLREWENEGGISVRFSRTLNGKGFKVIDNLDSLIEMFKSES